MSFPSAITVEISSSAHFIFSLSLTSKVSSLFLVFFLPFLAFAFFLLLTTLSLCFIKALAAHTVSLLLLLFGFFSYLCQGVTTCGSHKCRIHPPAGRQATSYQSWQFVRGSCARSRAEVAQGVAGSGSGRIQIHTQAQGEHT